MKEMIGGALQPLGDILQRILLLVPLPVVRLAFLLLLAALAFWVIRLAPQLPGKEESLKSPIRDLRKFAVILLVLQSVFYILF